MTMLDVLREGFTPESVVNAIAADNLALLRRSDATATLERPFVPDISVRSDGRTVYGIAIPFGTDAIVNDGYGPYTERFQRGAFAKTIRESGERIKLCINHEKVSRLPIGKAIALREDAAGLYGEYRISRTAEGDDALTLIRDGVVDSFSVGFRPIKERKAGPGVIERTEVGLKEVSVVSFPAYENAVIQGVRAEFDIPDDELDRLVDLVRAEPDLLTVLAQRAGRPVSALPTIDTPAAEAEAVTTPDTSDQEAADSEPVPATRASDTPDEGAVTPYQPVRPVPVARDRRFAEREDVRALVARLTRSA